MWRVGGPACSETGRPFCLLKITTARGTTRFLSIAELEEFRRGGIDFGGEVVRDRDGFHFAVGMMGNADDGEESGGDEDGRGVALGGRVFGADFAEAEKVGENAGALFLHEQMNLDEVLEAERFLVIARGVDSREAERRIK